MRNAAPATALAGSSVLLDGTSTSRTACGTTKPTNPTKPATATAAPVKTAVVKVNMRLADSTSTPNEAAVSSPCCNKSRSRDCTIAATRPSRTNGAHSQKCVQVRASSPPIIQNTMSCAICQFTIFTESSKLETAVNSDPAATPASSRVVTGVTPPRVAMAYTNANATSAPVMAARGSEITDVTLQPATKAITPPRTAPAPAPTRLGSASGLRNKACMITPEAASPAPTHAATNTRGIRISQTITDSACVIRVRSTQPAGSSFPATTRRTVPQPSEVLPIAIASTTLASKSGSSTA